LNTDLTYIGKQRETKYIFYQFLHNNQGPRNHSLNEELEEKINTVRVPEERFKFSERQEVHLKVKEMGEKIYSVNLENWAVKEVVDTSNP
jgi:hypothetical protein